MLVQHTRPNAWFVLGVQDVAGPVAGLQRRGQSVSHAMGVQGGVEPRDLALAGHDVPLTVRSDRKILSSCSAAILTS